MESMEEVNEGETPLPIDNCQGEETPSGAQGRFAPFESPEELAPDIPGRSHLPGLDGASFQGAGQVFNYGTFNNCSFTIPPLTQSVQPQAAAVDVPKNKVPNHEAGLIATVICKKAFLLTKGSHQLTSYETKHWVKMQLEKMPSVFGKYFHGAAEKIAVLQNIWSGMILQGELHPVFGKIPQPPYETAANVDSFGFKLDQLIFCNAPEQLILINIVKTRLLHVGKKKVSEAIALFEKSCLPGKGECLVSNLMVIGVQIEAKQVQNRLYLMELCEGNNLPFRMANELFEAYFVSNQKSLDELFAEIGSFVDNYREYLEN